MSCSLQLGQLQNNLNIPPAILMLVDRAPHAEAPLEPMLAQPSVRETDVLIWVPSEAKKSEHLTSHLHAC